MSTSKAKSGTSVSPRLCPVMLLFCVVSTLSINLAAQQQEPASEAPFQIQTDVNRVLVPVVVRDAKGLAVSDLKQQDFQVLSNGKPQPITGFSIEKHAPEFTAAAGGQQQSSSQLPQASSATPRRFIVFLFDDLHLSFEDLAHAQKAGAKVLADTLTPSDLAAVVSISGKTNSGLATDRAKLQRAIMSLHMEGFSRTNTADCPKLSYYQADQIENKHDSVATADAVSQVFACNPQMNRQRDEDTAERLAESAAMRTEMLGSQDVLATYATLRAVVHSMAGFPGERMLILVSPGFLRIDSNALTAESQIIDLAAQSNVTISTLDARGLYTTELTAGDNVIGNPQTQTDFRRKSQNANENPMSELANGTGGTFFHNSNDLNAGFKTLTQMPDCVYLLEISPEGRKPDGSFHHLKVKVDRDGLQLQARLGYFEPKPDKKTQSSPAQK